MGSPEQAAAAPAGPTIAARRAAGSPPGRRLTAILAVAGGVLVVALQFVAIEWQSVTTDEAYHIYAGFSALRYGTNASDLEQPPLVNLLAAAPLAAEAEPYAPPARLADAVRTGERLFEPPELAHPRIRRARALMLVAIALPLIAACFALGRRWADTPTGVLLALAVGLSMATLPQLALANQDAAVALGFVLTLLAGERFLRRPGWTSAALLGAACGLALSTKFSGVLAAAVVAAAIALAPRSGRLGRELARRIAAGVIVLAVAGLVVLAAGRAANPDYDPAIGRRSLTAYARGTAGLHVEDRLRAWEPRLLALERVSPAAAQWLAGLLSVTVQSSIGSGIPSYAFGTITSHGRWWYFPSVLVIKTPLVILAASVAAGWLALRRRRARPPPPAVDDEHGERLRRRRRLLAALAAAVFLAAALGSSYNRGIRYLLPVLPLLYLPAAWAAARRRATAVGFAALLAVEAVALAPRWMSATSTWWLGGADPARFALSMGDLEYHQNFRLLARDLRRRGVERVTVAFPGLGEPRLRAYLPGAAVADPSQLPGPGWHAVTVPIEQYVPAILQASPDELHGYARLRTVAEQWEHYLRALRLWGQDHGYAGETFHLYRIPEAPSGSDSGAQLLPVAVGSVEGDRQAAVGAAVDRVLDHLDLAAADVGQLALQPLVEAADQRRAAGEDDVVAHPLLVLGLDPGQQVDHGLDHRRQERLAGGAERLGDVDLGRLAVDRHPHHHPRARLADEAVALLPGAHHVDRKRRLGVALADLERDLLVEPVAGEGEGALVLLGRQPPLHDAEVGGAGADVDDHRVQQRLEAVGDGERLGDDHQPADQPLEGPAQALLVDPERLGGHPDDGVDAAVAGLDAGEAEQVAQQLAHRRLVAARALLDQPLLERPRQLEHRTVVERFAPDQHLALQHLAGDHVDRPADVAVDHVALAVGGRDRAARGPEIDPHAQRLALVAHQLMPPTSGLASDSA
jgi:hypothetical protein